MRNILLLLLIGLLFCESQVLGEIVSWKDSSGKWIIGGPGPKEDWFEKQQKSTTTVVKGPFSRLSPSPYVIKQQELKKEYPWLDSREEYNKERARILECFSKNANDKDVWVEFIPVLKSFAEYIEANGSEDIYHYAISDFSRSPFAGEEETQLIKADFSGRRDCLVYICRVLGEVVHLSTFALPEWFWKSRFLPEEIDLKGKDISKEKAKLRFRKIYNKNLAEFRIHAFTMIRKSILTGKNGKTYAEREKYWNEFCYYTRVTPEERNAAEKAVPKKVEKKPDLKKLYLESDVKISVDI
jgi:hypothetical protein